jgi:hypothetical protein
MSPARLAPSRLSAAALAAAALALASCGGGGGGGDAGGSALLQASCAVDSAGRVPFLTVLARATPAGGTVAAPIPATISVTNPTSGTITGSLTIGTNGVGLGEVFGAGLLRGVRATVTATVDGQAATATCVSGAGLPAVTPDATAAGGTITVTWPAVAGATAYRVALLDSATGLPSATQQVAASPATFTTALDVANLPEIRVAALSVTADAPITGALPVPSASHESFLLTSGTPTGGGAAWRVYDPRDFSGNTLTASFAGLGPTEQVAVLLVNTDGDDGFVPNLTVSGTGAAPARLAEPLPSLRLAAATAEASGDAAGLRRGTDQAHEAFRRWDAARLAGLATSSPVGLAPATAAAPAVPAAVGDVRTFCHAVFQLGTGGQEIVMRRRPATLRHVSGQAQFWVTDETWAGFQATITDLPLFWSTVGGAYDAAIKPALGTYFGDESDVDANGQMIFLFGNLGSIGSAFPVGYFTPGDTLPLDTTASCSGATTRGSNHADALYLTDPATFTSKGFAAADIRDVEYPGTMAHELQHNVNYNERCVKSRVLPGCAAFNAEDDWVNEGLSMVSEDAAGFGLATTLADSEFIRVGNYLRVYRDYSLTRWEGDPAGNYGGVHAFMRYWLDQQGPAFTKQVVTSGLYGRTGIEQVLGVPLETAMIRWANALVFSGESFSPLPEWDFASGPGVPWSPLHQTLKWVDRSGATAVLRDGAYVDYTPLPLPATETFPPLRADGWGLYLTGKGTGGTATVTVTTIAPFKPHVVLVRFAGTLPRQ